MSEQEVAENLLECRKAGPDRLMACFAEPFDNRSIEPLANEGSPLLEAS